MMQKRQGYSSEYKDLTCIRNAWNHGHMPLLGMSLNTYYSAASEHTDDGVLVAALWVVPQSQIIPHL